MAMLLVVAILACVHAAVAEGVGAGPVHEVVHPLAPVCLAVDPLVIPRSVHVVIDNFAVVSRAVDQVDSAFAVLQAVLELALVLGTALAHVGALAVLLAIDPLPGVLGPVRLPVDGVPVQSPGRPLTLVGRAVWPDLGAVAVPGVADPIAVVGRPARHLHRCAALWLALPDELLPPVLEEAVLVPRKRLLRGAHRRVDLLRESLVPRLLLQQGFADAIQLGVLIPPSRVGLLLLLNRLLEVLSPDCLNSIVVEDVFDAIEGPVLVEDVGDRGEAQWLARGGGQAEVLHLDLLRALGIRLVHASHGVVDVVNQLHNLVIIQLLVVLEDQTEPLDHPHLVDAVGPGLCHVQECRAVPDEARAQACHGLPDTHGLVDDTVVDRGELAQNRDDEEQDDEARDLVPNQHVRDQVEHLPEIHKREGSAGPELEAEAVVLADLRLPVHVQDAVDLPGDPMADRFDGHATDLARVRDGHRSVACAPCASPLVRVVEVDVDACPRDANRHSSIPEVIDDVLVDPGVLRVQVQPGDIVRVLLQLRVGHDVGEGHGDGLSGSPTPRLGAVTAQQHRQHLVTLVDA
mmetsp:Transcript_104580/g.234795  ORF Transcript_104580/g.234795 Transcript_104580/m.234795 type:complete len:574 (+) Transcript_104580:252-1973(+)